MAASPCWFFKAVLSCAQPSNELLHRGRIFFWRRQQKEGLQHWRPHAGCIRPRGPVLPECKYWPYNIIQRLPLIAGNASVTLRAQVHLIHSKDGKVINIVCMSTNQQFANFWAWGPLYTLKNQGESHRALANNKYQYLSCYNLKVGVFSFYSFI